MKKLIKIILAIIYSLTLFTSAIAIENKILFKVNNEIITSIDILTEINYLITINNDFSKMPKNQVFEIAKKSSHKAFAEKVPGGDKLMEMALAVK